MAESDETLRKARRYFEEGEVYKAYLNGSFTLSRRSSTKIGMGGIVATDRRLILVIEEGSNFGKELWTYQQISMIELRLGWVWNDIRIEIPGGEFITTAGTQQEKEAFVSVVKSNIEGAVHQQHHPAMQGHCTACNTPLVKDSRFCYQCGQPVARGGQEQVLGHIEKQRYNFNQNDTPPYKRTRIPEQVRIEVWRRDSGQCARCGNRERLEYDHIVPISKGGSNTARNIELLCEACNRSKGANIA